MSCLMDYQKEKLEGEMDNRLPPICTRAAKPAPSRRVMPFLMRFRYTGFCANTILIYCLHGKNE